MSLVEQAKAVRRQIVDRLRELEPLAREYDELCQLAAEMGIDEAEFKTSPGPAALAAQRPRAARRPARSRRSASQRSSASAPARADDDEIAARVLAAVSEEPGKTVAEYAKTLDLPPTALYRPVRGLTNQGAVVKRARALFPA
jgi:hypothetical protein